jgi:hypothetical protein
VKRLENPLFETLERIMCLDPFTKTGHDSPFVWQSSSRISTPRLICSILLLEAAGPGAFGGQHDHFGK